MFSYRWEIRDPELNNAVILDEYEDVYEKSSPEDLSMQVLRVKPFLQKYNLTISVFENGTPIKILDGDLPEVSSSDPPAALPPWQLIEPTYPLWIESYPWLLFYPHEDNTYPLYWIYSQAIRSKYSPEKPWLNTYVSIHQEALH